MNGLGTGVLDRLDDVRDIEVTLRSWRRTLRDAMRLIKKRVHSPHVTADTLESSSSGSRIDRSFLRDEELSMHGSSHVPASSTKHQSIYPLECSDIPTYHIDSLVCELNVQTVDIGIRVNGDGLDTHLLGGSYDAACDLSSVGDQDLVKGL